ncbi:4'-phosphopantetheinyl transferase family protein [Streptomyces fructofermentans]|uniref:4'-phosphopantetheinyl transferase family protein n=1 Tax=Streptomyces fructofermentans TaxID=152141 RepID=UPI00379E5606
MSTMWEIAGADPAAVPPPPGLRTGVVHLWYLELDELELPDGGDCLDGDERRRASRLQRAVDRRRYRAAHCALRHILAGYTGEAPAELRFHRFCPRCGPAVHGKPIWAVDSGQVALDVSLSHSDQVAMVAVCRPPLAVGVDVERVRAGVNWSAVLVDDGSGPHLADREGTQVWTRLEAVGKAAGTGVVDLPRIGELRPDGWADARVPGVPGVWFVRAVEAPEGFAAALAVNDLPDGTESLRWSCSPECPEPLSGTHPTATPRHDHEAGYSGPAQARDRGGERT